MDGLRVVRKRRNNEKRKEKSRDAARCRRSKESEIFFQLSSLLPLPHSVSSQLDKASVVRLSVGYLRTREILAKMQVWEDENSNRQMDHLFLKALDGFLLVLSADGDMVYTTENVEKHLGLAQVDLVGHSIYDYCHPADCDEVEKMLAARGGGKNQQGSAAVTATQPPQSFFIRMRCRLTSKGKVINSRAGSYKVIHFTGSVVGSDRAAAAKEEREDSNRYFVSVGEPIPHPANIESLLDKRTFLSRHELDMKFTYVDDGMSDLLGFSEDELLGKSVYQFHHARDSEAMDKSFRSLIAKGQCETGCYRFLAKSGGYVWLVTQATVIYGGGNGGEGVSSCRKPQCVVCVNYVVSGVENVGEIVSDQQQQQPLSVSEIAAAPPDLATLCDEVGSSSSYSTPLPSTNTIFTPLTEDMNKGFLMFLDGDAGYTVMNDEDPEDLTHLAPTAGDVCIPLDVPCFPNDMFEDVVFPDSFGESSLKADFPSAAEEMPPDDPKRSGFPLNHDPFLSFREDRTMTAGGDADSLTDPTMGKKSASSGRSSVVCSSTGSPPQLEVDDKSNEAAGPPSLKLGVTSSIMSALSSNVDLEVDDLEYRAPYIPMGIGDDLPLMNPADQLWGPMSDAESPPPPSQLQLAEECGLRPIPTPAIPTTAEVKSSLAQLLQSSAHKKQVSAASANRGGGNFVRRSAAYGKQDEVSDRRSREWDGGGSRGQPDRDRSPHGGSRIAMLLTSDVQPPDRGDPSDKFGVQQEPCRAQMPPSGAGSAGTRTSKWPLKPPDIGGSPAVMTSRHKRACDDCGTSAGKLRPEETLAKRSRLDSCARKIGEGDTTNVQNSVIDPGGAAARTPSGRKLSTNSVLLNLLISGHDPSHGYTCYANKKEEDGGGASAAARFPTRKTGLAALLEPNGSSPIPTLLDISQQDAEVNAPLQTKSHLLQGQELLNALDTTAWLGAVEPFI